MKSFLALLFIAVSVIAFVVIVRPAYSELQVIRAEVENANANLEQACCIS